MHNILTSLFLLLSIYSSPSIQSDPAIENAISKLTSELTSKYTSNYKVHIAILQFRTDDDKVSRFNQLIQNEMNTALGSATNIKVIEQYSVNHLIEEQGWSLANSSNFKVYSNFNESLFKTTGIIADVFIYGVISMEGDNVQITAYLLPNGISSNAIKATVKIPIKELPDNLFNE